MHSRFNLLIQGLLFLSFCSHVFGQEQEGYPCSMELANGDIAQMMLFGLNKENLRCSFSFRAETQMDVDHEKVRKIILSDEAAEPPAEGDQIVLQDYTLIYGTFLELTADEVVFDVAGANVIRIPLKQIARIVSVKAKELGTSPMDQDFLVRTTNGDLLSGRLEQKGKTQFTIKSDTLDATLERKLVDLIQFPLPELIAVPTNAVAVATNMLYAEVVMRNGARLFGQDVDLKNGTLSLKLTAGPLVSINMKEVGTLSFTRSMIPNSRSVLIWQHFADKDEEALRTKKVLEDGLPDWKIEIAEDIPVGPKFRSQLLRSRTLVIPEMEDLRSSSLKDKVKIGGVETSWKDVVKDQLRPTLMDYLRRGGRIVFLCIEPEHKEFMDALDFGIAIDVEDRTREATVAFTGAGAAVRRGLEKTFTTTDATAFYKVTAPAVAWAKDKDGTAPIMAQSVGPGQVVLMGMDFFEQNKETARILVNAASAP